MLGDLGAGRRGVGLEEVLAGAPALTRVDRKYVVPLEVAARLLDELDDPWRTLTIADRRTTHYRTTYLDTPDLASVRAHVQGRRRRWKARTRLYVEDGLRRVEVKVRDGRGRTVKTQAGAVGPGPFSLVDRAFVTRTLTAHDLGVDGAALDATATVDYERMTVARLGDRPARLTIDARMTCTLDGCRLWLDDRHVLVETKGDHRPGEPDLWLREHGWRPRSFSKYAATGALLRPDIADNDVRHLVGRVLHTHPLDHPVARTQPWSRSA